jgi:hypothetical protein
MIKAISNLTNSTMNSFKTPLRSALRRTTIFSRTRSLLRRTLVLALLALASISVKAADYVLTYTNGNTTYYLARNGTSGVQRVSTFDPTTCIWSCENSSGTASSLNNGTDYGWLYQTVNGTKYYLKHGGTVGLTTTKSTSSGRRSYNTTCWRTNGTYVYNAYQGNSYSITTYYVNLTSGVASATSASSTCARPYSVTTTTVIDLSTNPTISGDNLLTTTGNHNYSASGATFRVGYKNYYFNSANHYFDDNGNNITPANATLGTTTWNLTPNNYATVNGSGVVNVSSLPESDITLTLTATVPVSGGTPAAPSGTTLTGTKEITIQGTKPSAPTISVSGTTVTITTSAMGSTSIRYTIDGSTPTASTGTVYSNTFDISGSATSPVTIKAVTVRNGSTSDVSTQVVTLTLPEPTITINGEAKTATITSSVAGATIYYTTNGSTPSSTNGTQYTTGLTGLNYMTVIQAIAIKDGWNDSPVASETVTIPSGVSGGTVTLFDYEDHSWSYYSDASLPLKLRSLNPADVKITYNGNGTGTVQTNDNDNPSTWGADATTVKVGIDANDSTFVYYETLERTDGRTAASVEAATGRCAYTTIANPFSVRPTYDSDNTSKYRGFYAWRVKSLSGGTIHSAATGGTSYGVGSIINAETEIYFAPSSEYGMEVEFEALWARAYVSTSGVTNKNLGVERNFYVITASANSNITAGSSPCTYTSIYPNGTTNGTTAATSVTVYKYGGFTASADSKIEYIILRNNSSTMNANGKNFTIGRGVSGYNGGLCATNLYGLNATSTTSFRFNFASGSFTNLYFCGDGRTMSSGVLTSVIGCDYDRAMGDNSKLKVTSDIIAGHNGAGGSNNNEGADFLRCTVKSGDFDLGDYGGGVQFYLSLWGNTGSGTYGKKTMIIEGGIFSDISGGIDVEDTQVTAADMVEIRMKGGTVNGALYGAAQYAAAYGNRYIIITGGEVKGWVAGGANGTQTTGGKLTGDTYVYFGGRAKCDSKGSNTTMGSGNATGGNIFGAGSGNSGAASTATVGEVNNSTVVIADECYVERNVYGGGNYGSVSTGTGHKSDIYIKGGTVNGSVFGGSNNQKGQIVNINMTDGQVNTGIYGGSNATGTVAGPVTININGGQVGTSSSLANIHGGGYGSSTVVSGNIDLTVGVENATSGATIYGDVYGGSALGKVNGTAATTTYHTNVTLNKGTIYGSLYGGALGDYSTAANVYGPVTVTVNGGSVKKTSQDGSGSVYGCNNVNGAPQRSVAVVINGTDPAPSDDEFALYAVYGGGNQADYGYATPTVTVNNCNNSIEYVFGGGNAAEVPSTDVKIYGADSIGNVFGGGNGISGVAADVTGQTLVNIYGGHIGKVFGGSNKTGTIGGAITVNVNKSNDCTDPMLVSEIYGGGNMAPSSAGTINISCTGTDGYIGKVFGGANAAKISGNINLKINGGNIGDVFGGNNASGDITGTVSVTVGDAPENCGVFKIENVYGGGNLAPYGHNNDYPNVRIVSGTVTGGVYGGGYGQPAVITGNPQVTVTGGTIGAVYGGGNAAAVTGNTVVSVSNATVTGSVYGGGNAAGISGTTSVSVSSGTIGTGIYGGCNSQGNVGSTATVSITGGTIGTTQTPANIHGGGFGNETRVLGSVSVTLAGMTVNGDVYGGSAKGKTNGDEARTNGATTAVTMNSGTITGSIYGGGLGDATYAADVWGPVTLTINKGSTVGTNVYGGNNANGSPQVSIDVIVNGPTDAEATTTPLNLNNVYGGGNEADIAEGCTAPHVNIKGCGTVVNRAFGGGNAASVPATNLEIHGGTFQQVFGGGNGERGASFGADVNGNVNLKIYAGTITSVFGGSNANGTISGDMNVSIDAENGNTCGTEIVEIYGGGNMAAGNAGAITINNCDAVIDTLYGGAKAANVLNNIVLNLVKGQIGSAFGGNNVSGTIGGTITVNVNLDDCASLDYVYGAGNKAPYTGNPIVNVNNGTVNKSVYGGGKGASAVVSGNPVVTIGDATAAHCAIVTENVYGGGDAAAVDGSTQVIYNDNNANSTAANLFGGGNAAGVSGTATVTLTSGKVLTGVYGGCNASGTVGGAIALNINGGQVGTDATHKAYGIFGGGKGSATQTGDAVTVTIGTATNAQTYPTIYGDVYGGSAEGQVNDAIGEITKVWLKKGVINGDLYGGGFGDNGANALVNGSVQVVVDGGTVTGKVFGCNNANGTPKGAVTVTINGTDTPPSGYALSEVYGGGNMANYVPTSVTPATVVVNGCNNSIGVVYGGGNAADVLGTDVTIWGGTIGQVFGGGHGNKDANPVTEANVVKREGQGGNVAVKIYGGTITEVFGGSNSKGTIQGESTVTIKDNGGSCTFDITDVYGGGNQAEGNAGTLNIGCGAVITGNIYGGAKQANVNNDIHLIISGGNLHNVFGGNNISGNVKGSIIVDIEKDNTCDTWHVDNVYGGGNMAAYSVYGYNNDGTPITTGTSAYANHPVVNIKNGTVSVNVFGGGYGSTATVYGNPQVNLIGGIVTGKVFGGGESAPVTGSPVVTANYGQATNIYGGGLGQSAVVTGTPHVIINQTQDKTLTVTDVFGGGDAAQVSGGTLVDLTAGTVTRAFGGGNQAAVTGKTTVNVQGATITNVFGGGNEAGAGQTEVNITAGTVTTGIYGGSNANGTITGAIAVNVLGGTVGSSSTNAYGIFGGGKGPATRTGDNVTVTIGTTTSGPTIYGDVYGGSAEGQVNDDLAEITKVWLKKGTINGDLYGGGFGDEGANALVNGRVQVIVDGGTVTGSVFGCNNANGTPKGAVDVTINATDPPAAGSSWALGAVYGGGNLAAYSPTVTTTATTVTVNGCSNTIKDLFGGGNAAAVPATSVIINGGTFDRVFAGGNGQVSAANVTGNTSALIKGGTIRQVFGGSNQNGTIGGTINVEINKADGGCDMHITEVYGGGNQAASNAGNLSIVRTGGDSEGIQYVYGGANDADVTGDITLNITGGRITEAVFGGNNTGHTVNGNITVNVEWNNANGANDKKYLKDVFGGGNNAPYSNSGNYPAVNINNGTVSGNVFGGGKGTGATVQANPTVTIGDAVSGHVATVLGNVFGGGDAAGVTGNTTILLTAGTIGNGTIGDGTLGNVYGGGKQAIVTGNTTVKIEGGSVTTDVYGGGMQGDVTGDVTVNISKSGTPGTPVIGRDVYGGGALANTNTANNVANPPTPLKATVVNLYPGAKIGHDVYGGGRGQKEDQTNNITAIPAIVYGNVTVNQNGSKLTAAYSEEGLATGGRIFGGNNVNGTPKGHIKVHVIQTVGDNYSRPTDPNALNSTTVSYNYDLAAVYGGGNEAEYIPSDNNDCAEVLIEGCSNVSIHSVYGGGNAAAVPATLVTISGAYEIGYVFGGGNGAGTGNPGANVGYHAYSEHTSSSDEDKAWRQANKLYGTGVATTEVYGGRIHYIYGGSNTKGNVREIAVAMLDEVSTCPLVVDGIYGGGREAYMEGSSMLEMGCVTGLNEIYGGSEKADVGSNVELTITSGHFNKVFGGNNKGGRILGSIKVNIEQTGCVPITIDELYLGGNNAPYSVYGYFNDPFTVNLNGEEVTHYELKRPSDNNRIYDEPVLNIRSFKSIGNVYGGGNGKYAVMVANPTVDINVTQGWVNGEYVGNVAEYSDYKRTPALLQNDGVIDTVFGGGNAARVEGSPTVKIGDRINTKVLLKSMNDLYTTVGASGERRSDVLIQRDTKDNADAIKYTIVGDNNVPVSGKDPLTVNLSQTVKGATISGNVYGGGNAADVTGGTNIQVGPNGNGQSGNGGGNGAPTRSSQTTTQESAQSEAQQPAAQQQPAQSNAATESNQSRSVNANRAD